jgi:hypothetical protein
MFLNRSDLLLDNPIQLNYGIAVTDVDGDGQFEAFVAGYNASPNLVFKWTGSAFEDIADPILADDRQAIGVAAADIDGDGLEEIYILNTDTFAGKKRFADRLFDSVEGEWTDLFSLRLNRKSINLTAGRSVIAVDRDGDGVYGFFVANYGGPMRLYELDLDGHLHDVAPDAGVNLITGGRSAIALPLITERMDIYAGNENGPNFLFRNSGDGTFEDVAPLLRLTDPENHARGVTVLDATGNGQFDLVVGNWEGLHRLFVQSNDGNWEDIAPAEMAHPSRVRTVIAADFDNDGYEEIFFNNMGEPNRLFRRQAGHWQPANIGDALEPDGLGTGAAIGDFDGDGRLELLVAHGESGFQPLRLYHTPDNGHHFVRIIPLTQFGAPARGAVVTLEAGERKQIRVIDSGSGYLCQMEPVAHFGLGQIDSAQRFSVRWPDGTSVTIDEPDIDTLIRVEHPHTSTY